VRWYLKVLRQYADFNGRARRREYWMFTLFSALISLVLVGLFGGLGYLSGSQALLYTGFGLVLVWGLATTLPAIAVTTRRLHDTGRSGWWQLLNLAGVIPFVGWIGSLVVFVLCVIEGDRGPNRYGPDPKEGLVAAGFPPVPGVGLGPAA
jgi:uncharacterized membrane protein YhaH (DUF805 family)